MATPVSDTTVANSRTFELEKPFDYRGATYTRMTAREPKVKDLRQFLKDVDRDAILAMEKVLSTLTEVDEKIISELSIADFAKMKKWFESFMKPMVSESDD